MQIIRQSEFKSTPWKNGGGITREAIRVPADGDPFRWRVSVAHIDQPGPFSDFAAYRRIMVLLRGDGARLRFANGDERVLRAPGDLVEFDGAIAASCQLLGGPCVDLNLIAAKPLRGVRARVERLLQPLELPPAPGRTTLVFPIDAALELRTGASVASLEPWDLARVAHAEGQGCTLVPPAVPAGTLVFLATLPEP